MDPLPLALLALGMGVLIGVVVTAVVLLALRARERARVETSLEIPNGARDVLQGMDETAIVVDTSLLIVAASAPAEMFGMAEGSNLSGDELRALLRRARSTGHAQVETLRLRRGAEPRSVVARATPITPRLTLLVLRDITERERLEEMRRDFVANTSHELKTPVGAVTLLAEAIESASDDPEQVRYFAGRLTAEATRLGQLTSRIMNLSRLQSAEDLTELRDVSIDEVVTAALESQAVAADSAGITVVRGGDRGLYVRGDVQILIEAVGNLIANAIAYSPAGGQVGVGVKRADDHVEIAVTDRGIGIPEAEQERVFERFYRADQARSRRTGGTGLGLSIVKHAVQRHGGEVLLWSRPGRGSTFTIRLSAVEPAGAVTAHKKSKKPRKSKKRAGTSAELVKGDQP
ncbi:two-component sensor histidine kinase [Microbacterium saccharophilum]|uniref:Sensor-like histidine kinase SenX3 n=1 Tax=Microbacterium saccharophilum TaxID=1213358 RepID=A0A5C8HTF7_9MICO|nr:ATP-binding protein [Microbacterium saccharophilum]TXK08392.1 two-component sensor histidine kinase [Microbacterium saccharophilum]GEP48731.1 two-component sensor histidine kinase [Microbacterium saccharophilum]